MYLLCSTEISLQQRLEYIARAILSAKSSTAISSIAADGEFLHELEEKMEVRKNINLSYTVNALFHFVILACDIFITSSVESFLGFLHNVAMLCS